MSKVLGGLGVVASVFSLGRTFYNPACPRLT